MASDPNHVCSSCGGTERTPSLNAAYETGVRWRCARCHRKDVKNWVKKNPEKRADIRRRYYLKYREKYRREHWSLKLEVFMNMGGECVCCGEQDIRFLTLDHINGGGAKHRRSVGNSTIEVYKDVQRQGYPKDKFRLYCWNCHMATRFGDLCPHKEKDGEVEIAV